MTGIRIIPRYIPIDVAGNVPVTKIIRGFVDIIDLRRKYSIMFNDIVSHSNTTNT